MFRTLNDIQNDLQRTLNSLTFRCELLRNVQLRKKKDGTDFANKSQSFINATWVEGGIPKVPRLIVSGYNEINRGGESYTIYCYYQDSDCSRSDTGIVAMTPDEVMQHIDSILTETEIQIQRYKAQLERLPAIYDDFSVAVQTAVKKLKDDCSDLRVDKFPCTLEYRMLDYMHSINYSIL